MMLTKLQVLGDSGHAYDVAIDPNTRSVECSCPAFRFAKGVKMCKHIVFAAGAFGLD